MSKPMKSVIQKDLLKTNKDKCIHMSSENSSVSEKSVSQPKEKNRGAIRRWMIQPPNQKVLKNIFQKWHIFHKFKIKYKIFD